MRTTTLRTGCWASSRAATRNALVRGTAVEGASSTALFGSSRGATVLSASRSQQVEQRRHTSVRKIKPGEELSFALITPKSLAKSLTGGIIARLLATPDLQIVGARMLSPSAQLTEDCAQEMNRAAYEDGVIDPYEKCIMGAFHDIFGEKELKAKGITNHVMMLLFAGSPNTRKVLEEVVGSNVPDPHDFGRTIRGTYGDYYVDANDNLLIFQPAVLVPQSETSNRKCLEIFAKYLDSDHALKAINKLDGEVKDKKIQTGLVMIKPDNLERPSSLPGHIIDLFGTTGLELVGARVFSMSVQSGLRFYGFLEGIFAKKLKPGFEELLKQRLANAFEFPVKDEDWSSMADVLIKQHAHAEVAKIVQYMTGVDPDTLPSLNETVFGPAKCFALLYRGENAIEIIRSKLGVTDPKKAKAGTIRSDYGHDLMRNGAHASDSPEAALREREIVGLMGDEPSQEKAIIEDWLNKTQ